MDLKFNVLNLKELDSNPKYDGWARLTLPGMAISSLPRRPA